MPSEIGTSDDVKKKAGSPRKSARLRALNQPVGVGRTPRLYACKSGLAYAKLGGMQTVASKLLPVFRKNVESHMARLKWDRGDLANAMGCTPSYVTQILGKHRGVGLNTLENVAQALGVPASDLLKPVRVARRAS